MNIRYQKDLAFLRSACFSGTFVFIEGKGVKLQVLEKELNRKVFFEIEKAEKHRGEIFGIEKATGYREEQAVGLRSGKRTQVENMVLAAMFLALGIVMPFLTGQIPAVGNRLLPMHIPVLICGFVCGWKYGLIVGFVVPVLRSIMFGMPPMFPTGAAMAFELAAYGAVTGFGYEWMSWRRSGACDAAAVYGTLIAAMLVGRLVWGLVSIPLYGLAGNVFNISVFAAGAFLNAIPGIVLQLVIIPVIVMTLKRAKMMES